MQCPVVVCFNSGWQRLTEWRDQGLLEQQSQQQRQWRQQWQQQWQPVQPPLLSGGI
jgi:hypothetical protein